jgi:hypothetical protein
MAPAGADHAMRTVPGRLPSPYNRHMGYGKLAAWCTVGVFAEQNAVSLAWFACNAAMMNERFPR